jgi:hypothetical protein
MRQSSLESVIVLAFRATEAYSSLDLIRDDYSITKLSKLGEKDNNNDDDEDDDDDNNNNSIKFFIIYVLSQQL